MERRIKRVEELGPFEEWGLSEECLSFLKKVKADPEKVLVIVRLGSIEFGDDLFFEHPSYQWCDDDLLYKEYPSTEFRKELDAFYREIIDSLQDFCVEREYSRFASWITGFMGDFDHYFSCTRTWKDLLFYPDGTFNHKRYESIDTNVDKKVTRLLQEYRSILSPEQYCLFGSLLLGWEIIDYIVVLEDDVGRSSISCVYGLGRRECDRILSEYEWRIYDDFYDDSRSHCFFERIAEIILM